MTTSVAPTFTTAAPTDSGAEQRLLLYGISWEAYEQISSALEPHPGKHLTYYHGALEIMTTSYLHEKIKGIAGDTVKLIAYEMEIDLISSGETTFRLKRLGAGFEGDDSFYFSDLERLRQQTEHINLEYEPAPDLVIEVDISNPSLSKFPMFADMGIHEVWRWHDNAFTFYQLSGQEYEERAESRFLPGVTAEAVTELILEHQTIPAYVWQRKVRKYARQCLKH